MADSGGEQGPRPDRIARVEGAGPDGGDLEIPLTVAWDRDLPPTLARQLVRAPCFPGLTNMLANPWAPLAQLRWLDVSGVTMEAEDGAGTVTADYAPLTLLVSAGWRFAPTWRSGGISEKTWGGAGRMGRPSTSSSYCGGPRKSSTDIRRRGTSSA